MPPLPKTLRTFAPLLAAALLASCSDRAADLQIRLTAVQDELDHARAELDAAHRPPEPGAASSSDVTTGVSGAPTLYQIEQNYEKAVSDFQEELKRNFTDGKVQSVIAAQPKVEAKPYHGDFAVEATVGSRPVRVERVPVEAGLDGKWSFPSPGEVIGRLRQASSAPVAREPSASAPPSPAPQPELSSPMQASQTVVVDWGDRPRPAQNRAPEPSAPSPAPPPAPARRPERSAPSRVMPADHDVHIKF